MGPGCLSLLYCCYVHLQQTLQGPAALHAVLRPRDREAMLDRQELCLPWRRLSMHFTGDVFTRVGTLSRDKNILEGNGTNRVEAEMGKCKYKHIGGSSWPQTQARLKGPWVKLGRCGTQQPAISVSSKPALDYFCLWGSGSWPTKLPIPKVSL